MLISFLGSCGEISLSPTFTINIIGNSTPPDDATGNASPISVTCTIKKVTLIDENDNKVEMLKSASEVSVIKRPQKIAENSIPSSIIGSTYTKLNVEISTILTIKSLYNEGATITLATTTYSYEKEIVIKKGYSMTLDIALLWGKTVTRDDTNTTDTITGPDISLALTSS